MGLSAVLLSLAFLWADAAGAAGPNAADVYRQAFQAAPSDKETVEQLRDYDKIPIEDARKIVARYSAAMKAVADAGAVAACDWKIAAVGDADLSFLNQARSLSELIGLQARISAADGKPDEAIRPLAAAITMGRRLQQIAFPVARLVGQSIQGSAMNNAAACLPQAGKASCALLTAALDAAITVPSIEEAIKAEFQTTPYRAQPPGPADRDRIKASLEGVDNATATMAKMLAAGIVWRTEGEEAMNKKVPDPFGNGPFAIRKWQGGFELTSKLSVRGHPVSMVIGKEQ